MTNHRCGGELQPTKIKIRKKIGFYFQNFTVDGFKCDNCGEETITRDTAIEIDKTIEQLRHLWKDWRVPSSTKVIGKPVKEQVFKDNTYVKV